MSNHLSEETIARRSVNGVRMYAVDKLNSLPAPEREKLEDICEGYRRKLIRNGYPQIAIKLSDTDLLSLFIQIGSRIRETERK